MAPPRPRNILVILSDQHHPGVLGYRGHPHVQTPHLDRLAADGVQFTRAYCTSPICVPSRMSLITGQYCHRIGVPNMGFPLDRSIMTWPRHLAQAGWETIMVGKMDLCGEYQDGGFSRHRIIHRRPVLPGMSETPPYHLTEPFFGRLPDAYRSWRPVSRALRHAGPRTNQIFCREKIISNEIETEMDDFIGNYDHDVFVSDWAVEEIRQRGEAARSDEEQKPWLLYVGLLLPHEPFTIPAEYYDRYYPDNISMPFDARFPNPDLHPALQFLQNAHGTGQPTTDDLRRTIAAYYGMVSCLDDQIGRILSTLEEQGFGGDTLVIYTSDHGESLGEHGLFFKKCSYEGSAGVPLIMRGPGLPGGGRVDAPVDLVDLYPTLINAAGLDPAPDLQGSTWLPLARGAPPARDFAFSEYHAFFMRHDWFLIAHDRWKYTWYSNGAEATLFDLVNDPREMQNLASDPLYRDVLRACHERLLTVCDPEEESYRAKMLQGLIGPNGEDYTEPDGGIIARA